MFGTSIQSRWFPTPIYKLNKDWYMLNLSFSFHKKKRIAFNLSIFNWISYIHTYLIHIRWTYLRPIALTTDCYHTLCWYLTSSGRIFPYQATTSPFRPASGSTASSSGPTFRSILLPTLFRCAPDFFWSVSFELTLFLSLRSTFHLLSTSRCKLFLIKLYSVGFCLSSHQPAYFFCLCTLSVCAYVMCVYGNT